jgi:hypothetical protein
MFVQATKSKRGAKTYVSYLVRESFRTEQGPRSRTVCNISALPPAVRELVRAALAGKPCVPLEQLELSAALNYGGLAVLRDAWQRFGLERLVADIPNPRERSLLQALVLWARAVSVRQTGAGRRSPGHVVGGRLRAEPSRGDLSRKRALPGHGCAQWPLGLNRKGPLRRGLSGVGQPGALRSDQRLFRRPGAPSVGRLRLQSRPPARSSADASGGGHRYPGHADPSGSAARQSGRYDHLAGALGQPGATLWPAQGGVCVR